MTIRVRPLVESDLDEADRIMRLAFGTFMGLPDPMAMWGDGGYAHSRWRSDPEGALAAEHNGRLAGSNFAVRWGSLGYFGPLSVRTELWDHKVGQHLMEATMATLERWGVRHRGLYTFAQSPKHIALYQRYGFWPRFLSAVMQKEIQLRQHQVRFEKFSALSAGAKAETIAACRELTDSLFAGLDLRREIEASDLLGLGETILARRDLSRCLLAREVDARAQLIRPGAERERFARVEHLVEVALGALARPRGGELHEAHAAACFGRAPDVRNGKPCHLRSAARENRLAQP